MRLTGDALPRLLAAIGSAFSPSGLEQLLMERWNKHLYHYAGVGNAPWAAQILAVVSDFENHNTTERLLIALRDARPSDPELVALAELAGFTQYGNGMEVYLVPGQPPSPDTVDFRLGLAQRENAICRVQTAKGSGTGILIGADLVLTNHHVVPVDATGALADDVACLFDHKIGPKGYTTPTMKVTATQAAAFSPPAREDYVPWGVAVDPDRLDYVLLQLATKVGHQAIVAGFEPRQFVPIGDEGLPPTVNTGIVMLQHPLGQVMKVDVGSVTWQDGTRLRHNAPTAKGSSGAPLFDVQLRLIGLHHAGQEWPAVAHPYNQAIPISLIAADLRKKMIAI